MTEHEYILVPVVTSEQWSEYHAIRRKALFEDRGHFDRYNSNHPDDRKKNNHPVILKYKEQTVAAMRIDIVLEKAFAIMRTIAVLTDKQRQGYGRIMLLLAENYALKNGCTSAVVFGLNESVGFYIKCGYEYYRWDPSESYGQGVQMRKILLK
jgi:GNAT superfamily N-acetyltransferase